MLNVSSHLRVASGSLSWILRRGLRKKLVDFINIPHLDMTPDALHAGLSLLDKTHNHPKAVQLVTTAAKIAAKHNHEKTAATLMGGMAHIATTFGLTSQVRQSIEIVGQTVAECTPHHMPHYAKQVITQAKSNPHIIQALKNANNRMVGTNAHATQLAIYNSSNPSPSSELKPGAAPMPPFYSLENFFNRHAIRAHIAGPETTREDREDAYKKAQNLVINAGDKKETSELCTQLAQGFLRNHDDHLATRLMVHLATNAKKDMQPHHRLAIDHVGRTFIDLAPHKFNAYRDKIMESLEDDSTQTLMAALTIRHNVKLAELLGPNSRAKDLAPSQG